MITHSRLGPSGAERWMKCPGSVELLKHLELPESDEPDYRKEGTAAHEAAAYCLRHAIDAWEINGQEFNGVPVAEEMADGIQIYIDECRSWGPLPAMAPEMETWIASANMIWYIEHPLASPGIHPEAFGTVDFALVNCHTLRMRDFKYGQGIVVEAYQNPQLMYYAFMLLRLHPEVRQVDIGVVQPRAFHADGPVRRWETDAAEILDWGHTVLIPAMQAVEIDRTLDPGPHCRFCPAKLVCPAMAALANAAASTDANTPVNLTDERLGADYCQLAALEMYIKAVRDETFRRLNSGIVVPGTKLVAKRANRVWKPEATDALTTAIGLDAFTEPALKSPAEMEKVSAAAKVLVKELAYLPDNGLTVALAGDQRLAITVQKTEERFAKGLDNIEGDAA